MTTTIPAFHSQLRDGTHDLHTKLDQLEISLNIVSPGITRAVYADYLERLYSVHHAMETNVFPSVKQFFADLELRKKSHLILEDLQSLGHSAPATSDPLFESPQHVSNAMGMCYVTEGSTLGSRFILKNITQSLNLTPEHGCKFLNCYGDTTGTMWKEFIGTLTRYAEGVDAAEKGKVMDGAKFAFERVYSVLV